MKRLQRVSGTGAFTALLASSLISAGCGGTWNAPVIPSTVNQLLITANFQDASGATINSGTATFTLELNTDGATGNQTDFQGGGNPFPIQGGSVVTDPPLPSNGYVGADPNNLVVTQCAATITYVNPEGQTVTCTGVPGFTPGTNGAANGPCGVSYQSIQSGALKKGQITATGTFKLPANGQGCTGGSTGAPPTGGTGGSGGGTPPGPGTGGPSAYFDILAPRRQSNPGKDYNGNGFKPDDSGSDSEQAAAHSARV